MNYAELERLYLKSLDSALTDKEREQLELGLVTHPEYAKELAEYDAMRALLKTRHADTFGPYFATKVLYKIRNTGVVVDREIFSYFRKFQLAAFGIVIALLALNIFFSEGNILSALGLESTSSSASDIISFDYSELLNENL